MFINETLARGLTNRFFQDFDKDIAPPFAKELKSKPLRNIKRGKWIKAARVQVKRLERFLIASYEGGSKVKPYFVTTSLAILDSRGYNTWNEKCLFSMQGLLSFDPAFVDAHWGHFNIGEHAIMRLRYESASATRSRCRSKTPSPAVDICLPGAIRRAKKGGWVALISRRPARWPTRRRSAASARVCPKRNATHPPAPWQGERWRRQAQ
jgi:hypothetical protein